VAYISTEYWCMFYNDNVYKSKLKVPFKEKDQRQGYIKWSDKVVNVIITKR
jgi:hypothetical protein